nr:60S ribosomal protein L21 [Hymenolepis microstoma]
MDSFEKLFEQAVKSAREINDITFKPIEGIETIITHGGHNSLALPDLGHPVVSPITLSTTFQQLAPATGKYEYSRSGNYSRHALEKCLAELDNGSAGFAFASGLAALNALLQILEPGDHVVAFDDLYGGSVRYFRKIANKFGIEFSYVDMRDPEAAKTAIKPSTKMVFIETPSNPLMRLVDIAAVSHIAHAINPNILVVVDSTYSTPYFLRPLDLGADITLASLTKYINGHSDVVMGSLVIRKDLPEVEAQLRFTQNAAGGIASPFDSYLCLRGLRTLAVRMRAHMINGLIIANFLAAHPKVEAVLHPGLKTHPQHELACRQMGGFSGMVCVYLKSDAKGTANFVKNLKYFALAESLGGYESLIEIPAVMTHASVPEEHRRLLGISDSMIRISVGLEDCRDLVKDLYDGLEKL